MSYADVRAELDAAVAGSDPAEIASLGDALESPGRARLLRPRRGTGSRLLAAELRRLRVGAMGEPILDLVRRIIDTCGIDVELASSASPAASARRDNLDLFVQAVSEFQAVDGQVTLAALLAWLEAEDEYGQGLDVATPSEADSVKLLTVHRAKGLEWDAVFLVGVTERKFPTNRSRSSWLTVPFVMPARAPRRRPRPADAGRPHPRRHRRAGRRPPRSTRRVEELRLGYVAWTRARHRLACPAGAGPPTSRPASAPRPTSRRTREAMADWGERARAVAATMPPKGDAQPLRRRLARPALADLPPHRRGRAAP